MRSQEQCNTANTEAEKKKKKIREKGVHIKIE